MTDTDKNTKLDGISLIILIISGVVILFSFFSPIIFVQETILGFNFTTTGPIGDTIGGIMNPFIAIAGVFLTFLAFYIQFKANRLQRDLFRQELDYNKFENQFYEMLKLHKANVNEIQIDEVKLYIQEKSDRENSIDRVEKVISGRKAFDFLKSEFEIIYLIAKKHFPHREPKIWVNEAYGVFFHGLRKSSLDLHDFYKEVDNVKEQHKKNHFTGLPKTIDNIVKHETNIQIKDNLRFDLFEGHSSQLAHYYRHLYQTVKFVVNQDKELLSYNEKRKYLRILRAQLSNQEQAMLFYNWLSDFGKQWNNEKNKFFTDYRMIHNIYQELIMEEVNLKEIFDFDSGYLKEENREIDPLFEFQDWKE
ncbi:putative phage abortive infection protein [bacterium SCSIO 12741]|nr:putative phage abortive infection protein [bacterium SCSIO 12741]